MSRCTSACLFILDLSAMFLPHSKQEYRPPPSRCIIDSTTAFKSKIGRIILKTQIPTLSLRFRISTTVHFKTIIAGTSWKKGFFWQHLFSRKLTRIPIVYLTCSICFFIKLNCGAFKSASITLRFISASWPKVLPPHWDAAWCNVWPMCSLCWRLCHRQCSGGRVQDGSQRDVQRSVSPQKVFHRWGNKTCQIPHAFPQASGSGHSDLKRISSKLNFFVMPFTCLMQKRWNLYQVERRNHGC